MRFKDFKWPAAAVCILGFIFNVFSLAIFGGVIFCLGIADDGGLM